MLRRRGVRARQQRVEIERLIGHEGSVTCVTLAPPREGSGCLVVAGDGLYRECFGWTKREEEEKRRRRGREDEKRRRRDKA